MSNILCIDREREECLRLEDTLRRVGHHTLGVTSLEEALEALDRESVDLVVSGLSLSTGDEEDLVSILRRDGYQQPVILITPEGAATDGPSPPGVEHLSLPLALSALRTAVAQALAACGLEDRLTAAAVESEDPTLVGRSPVIRQVLDMLRRVAPTRADVLIEGESGTGKERLVCFLHERSPRAGAPFVAINCAALPEGLVESTLFGHERGSFTGASARTLGAFERAHGGTLLLDEISELRMELQAKLLRVIQERRFERVGGNRTIPVDVRIVATTNRDLREEVRAGRFREDLYYRLRVVPIHVPPLRERTEDIALLVAHFAARTANDLGIAPPPVPPATLGILERYPWPGNVRELEHAVERAVILYGESAILPEHFDLEGLAAPPAIHAVAPPASRPEAPMVDGRSSGVAAARLRGEELNLKALEERTILRALEVTGGHRGRAAELLGISDRTLRSKLNGAGGLGRDRSELPRRPADSAARPPHRTGPATGTSPGKEGSGRGVAPVNDYREAA